jgi:hypothetical protein
MTPRDASILRASPEPAAQAAMAILDDALLRAEDHVTARIETQMQNALYQLRAGGAGAEAIGALESAAARLRLMAEAKRAGCCNLYMSQLLRLRKQMQA